MRMSVALPPGRILIARMQRFGDKTLHFLLGLLITNLVHQPDADVVVIIQRQLALEAHIGQIIDERLGPARIIQHQQQFHQAVTTVWVRRQASKPPSRL